LLSTAGDRQNARPTFRPPEWEELSDENDSLHVNRIVPVHPLTERAGREDSAHLRLNTVQKNAALRAGRDARRSHPAPGLMEGVPAMSGPLPGQHEALKRRGGGWLFDELFLLQMRWRRRSAPWASASRNPVRDQAGGAAGADGQLPFELTAAQQR